MTALRFEIVLPVRPRTPGGEGSGDVLITRPLDKQVLALGPRAVMQITVEGFEARLPVILPTLCFPPM